MYLVSQKRNGRQGLWGIIPFFYAIYSVIRNRASIAAHRGAIPFIVFEGNVYPRPKLHIRKDAPTLLAVFGFALLITSVIIYNVQNNQPIPRDTRGQVTSQTQAGWGDIVKGDCVMQAKPGKSVMSLDITNCARPHSWQVYAVSHLRLNAFSKKDISREAKHICNTSESSIDRNITDKLNADLSVIAYEPTATSWNNGNREITCLVGGNGLKLTSSVVK